jgi:hypothetical protein
MNGKRGSSDVLRKSPSRNRARLKPLDSAVALDDNHAKKPVSDLM